jgi:hypothetical protein
MMFYDKDGLAVSMQSWATLRETDSYVVLKQEDAKDGSWVSTVWIGIDHSFGGKKPLIFETMVFPSRDNLDPTDCRRYPTKKEALAGHSEIMKSIEERPKHHLRKLEP